VHLPIRRFTVDSIVIPVKLDVNMPYRTGK
jgi:hypothetical protein